STAHRAPWLVSVGVPSAVALQAISSRLYLSILLGLGALAVAAAIALMFSGRIVRPLRRLQGDAAVLAAGDFTHRTTVDTRDEVGAVADAFNRMALSLERREQETSCATEDARCAMEE